MTMDEMTIDILAKSEIAPLVWAFRVKNAVNYHANVINRNIYGTTGWDGVLKRVMETLSDAISQVVSQTDADKIQESKAYAKQIIRIFEKKVHDTLNAMDNLMQLTYRYPKYGYWDDMLTKQREALMFIEQEILSELEPAFSAIDTKREKKFTLLREKESMLRKYMYYVVTGSPPEVESEAETKSDMEDDYDI